MEFKAQVFLEPPADFVSKIEVATCYVRCGDKLLFVSKRETNPPGQEIRKRVFDYDSLTTHREEVRKAFDCYAP
jgi:hypothetical protein